MTTKVGSFTFIDPQPLVTLGGQQVVEKKQKLFSGTTMDSIAIDVIQITLEGKLMGVDKFTHRDSLIAQLSGGTSVDYYSTDISYGTPGSPKTVFVKSFAFVHPTGGQEIQYEITLLEAT